MSKRFRSAEDRKLFAFALAMDPNMKECVQQLFRMGAYNIRHDTMYTRDSVTGNYDRLPDPGAWNCDLDAFGKKNSMGVTLLRTRQGEWFLNGC